MYLIRKNSCKPDAFENNNANAQTKTNINSKSRDFKIMSLNIFTLMKHLDELRVLADHQKPDILAINETKIDDKISNQEIAIDGYYVDRNEFGVGDGIYIQYSV